MSISKCLQSFISIPEICPNEPQTGLLGENIYSIPNFDYEIIGKLSAKAGVQPNIWISSIRNEQTLLLVDLLKSIVVKSNKYSIKTQLNPAPYTDASTTSSIINNTSNVYGNSGIKLTTLNQCSMNAMQLNYIKIPAKTSGTATITINDGTTITTYSNVNIVASPDGELNKFEIKGYVVSSTYFIITVDTNAETYMVTTQCSCNNSLKQPCYDVQGVDTAGSYVKSHGYSIIADVSCGCDWQALICSFAQNNKGLFSKVLLGMIGNEITTRMLNAGLLNTEEPMMSHYSKYIDEIGILLIDYLGQSNNRCCVECKGVFISASN